MPPEGESNSSGAQVPMDHATVDDGVGKVGGQAAIRLPLKTTSIWPYAC